MNTESALLPRSEYTETVSVSVSVFRMYGRSQRIAVTEQDEPAIDDLFAFVFPAAVNAKQRGTYDVGCLLVLGH